ncbi:MAG: hypothetical protein IJP96_07020 [Synergistaceae bacterium]|nr:hypothetical protein [Synergistaceae bacterium]
MEIDLSFHKALSGRRRNGNKNNETDTPSGVTYDQFMQMSDKDKADFVFNVINNPNIIVPDYLDESVTSKVMYALGMNNKPEVVSDAKLDKIKGKSLYRTVSDAETISGTEILDQIRYGDYTQLSRSGGSVYGRAIYFSTDFERSAMFGFGSEKTNPVMMRAKINPNAKIIEVHNLSNMSTNSKFIQKLQAHIKGDYTKDFSNDWMSLTALANGFDGWRVTPYGTKSDYVMIINRRVLTASSTSKKIDEFDFESWHESKNAN